MLKSTIRHIDPQIVEVYISGLKTDLATLVEAIEDEDAEGIRYALDDIRQVSEAIREGSLFLARKFDRDDES